MGEAPWHRGVPYVAFSVEPLGPSLDQLLLQFFAFAAILSEETEASDLLVRVLAEDCLEQLAFGRGLRPLLERLMAFWINRPLNRVADPSRRAVGRVDQAHFVMRIKVVACFAAGDVKVQEIFAGSDVAIWQLFVESAMTISSYSESSLDGSCSGIARFIHLCMDTSNNFRLSHGIRYWGCRRR